MTELETVDAYIHTMGITRVGRTSLAKDSDSYDFDGFAVSLEVRKY